MNDQEAIDNIGYAISDAFNSFCKSKKIREEFKAFPLCRKLLIIGTIYNSIPEEDSKKEVIEFCNKLIYLISREDSEIHMKILVDHEKPMLEFFKQVRDDPSSDVRIEVPDSLFPYGTKQ